MQPRVNYARIRKRAHDLIVDQHQAPIDLEPVAKKLGAQIRFHELAEDISGVLYRDGDRRIIVANAGHSDVRKRFTIAHELGHLALHRGDRVHVDHEFRINLRDPRSATAENVEEVEANAFAANLLMPAEWIWKALAAEPFDLGDDGQIAALASRFGVSQHALLIRIAALNPFARVVRARGGVQGRPEASR